MEKNSQGCVQEDEQDKEEGVIFMFWKEGEGLYQNSEVN